MFSYWRQELESEEIHLQVIPHWEIKDHSNDGTVFLFVDQGECSGIKTLNRYLCHNKGNNLFVTITDYLIHMSRLAGVSFLKELQNQGVFLLGFDFEKETEFYDTLFEKVKKRNEEYGGPFTHMPSEIKKIFAGELYCEAYEAQTFPLAVSFRTQLGIPYLSDAETEFLHIRNGERLTVNQPEKYDRSIYLYGSCPILGVYLPDQYTIPSLLQTEINQGGFSCKVVNRGFLGDSFYHTDRVPAESLKQGDIVILDRGFSLMQRMENLPVLNFTEVLEKHNIPTDWIFDDIRHCSHKANQIFAHEIYEALVPVLQQLPGERKPVEHHYDYIDLFFLDHYFSKFDYARCGTVGSIVMNCNPFTLGHRFLIQEALKIVDFLIIFVVEEDESIFSFQERFAMVCQGTSDLKRVMIVPSGSYILSKTTFPEYFQKISDEDLKRNTEDDITLFAEKIAPRLGIKYRFVGEEKEDAVTNEYNEAMKRILPQHGIQVVEIPRKANKKSVISASRVRQCLAENRMEELDELIPASTKRILFYEDK